jgi:glycosyltransferase involved in cell wall biosynthesis
MSDKPLVSIIVRTKDRPELLKKAMQSIAFQTYRPIEVVLVNDGGCDLDVEEIKSILVDIALNYTRLEKNTGRPHAGNVAIENAGGKYIGFLDDDDEFYPEHVSKLVSCLENNLGFSCSYSDSEIIQRHYNSEGQIISEQNNGIFKSVEFSYTLLLFENYITLICSLIKKEILEDINGFDEEFEMFEDWDLFIRASEKKPFCHVPAVTTKYIQWSSAHQIAFIDRPEARNYFIKVLAKHHEKRTPESVYQYFTAKQREIDQLRNFTEDRDSLVYAKAALEEDLRAKNRYIENLLEEKYTLESELTIALDAKAVLEVNREKFQRDKETLEKELREKTLYINDIENTAGWRFLQLYRKKVKAKIFPLGTKRERAYKLILKGLLTLQTKGTRFLFEKVIGKVREELTRKRIRKEELVLPVLNQERSEIINKTVSVVIPTKNAGGEFKNTLEKISGQKGIKEIETIIVDSGSEDNTVFLAEQYGAKVIKIRPEEFNHGKVRNTGAEQSTGDYIFFMSQDVVPIGNECFYSMIKIMEKDKEISAATARQIPRSDADLFACWQLWYYYTKLMDFSDDYVAGASPQDLAEMSPVQRRRWAQLDNIFSCVKRDVFDNFKFSPIPYAEDLDLGLRLISGGYKIAFFSSIGVIHSHNRNPSYYFRRSFVDIKHLVKLLTFEPIRWDHFGVISAKDMLSSIYAFYLKLNSLKNVLENEAFKQPVKNLITTVKTFLQDKSPGNGSYGEKSMDDLFEKLFPDKNALSLEMKECNDILLRQYSDLVDSFGEFLSISGNVEDKKDEFISSLYKLFAVTGGSNLGNFAMYLEQKNLSDPLLVSAADILGENI